MNSFNRASRTLRWTGGSTAELLCLAREHAGSLRTLHVEDLHDEHAMSGLLEILPSCTSLSALAFRWCHALTGLPESVRQLTALTTLDLNYCDALVMLPESLVALSITEFSAIGCNLVFPPQPVADAGFPAVKRFLQDFARGAAPLQRDRVILVGNEGAGKTTLAMALGLHADPAGDSVSMRASLREKLTRWPQESLQHWLRSELGPQHRCSGPCEWCLGTTTVSFQHLLGGLVVDVSSLRLSGCRTCARVLSCVDFLNSPSFACSVPPQEYFADLIKKRVDNVREVLLKELSERSLEKWKAFLKLDKVQWKDDYGLYGVDLVDVLDIIAMAANHQISDAPNPQSIFDILRFIPHVMTRGVELQLAPLASPPVTIWDFAGQFELFPVHQFLLANSSAIYTVVFDARCDLEPSVRHLSHWLSFISSSLDHVKKAAFGEAPHQRQGIKVVLVATHTDSKQFKALLDNRPWLMTELIYELSARFSPQLHIHQKVFSPAYDLPDGGQLRDYCILLAHLATDNCKTHSIPASYIEVYKLIVASRSDSVARKQLPFLSEAALLGMMQKAGLEPDAFCALLPTLEAYGFLKRLKSPPGHLLADPAIWLTTVLGEFVSPAARAVTMTSTRLQATPAIALATVVGICSTQLQLSSDQVPTFLSVLCELDVCYEVPGNAGYVVFLSLLPPLTQQDKDVVSLANWSTSQVLFGRRFLTSDGGALPPALPLLLHRRLHELAHRVVCVRRDHFFFELFDCHIMVRFNTAAALDFPTAASSGRTACSIDIAVSAHKDLPRDNAGCALDRVVLELALELARPKGPSQLQSLLLNKHAFGRHNPASDEKYASRNLQHDEVMGDLVWVDNLVCRPTAQLEQARQKLHSDHKVVWRDVDRAALIGPMAEDFRRLWIRRLEAAKAPPATLSKFAALSADQTGSLLTADHRIHRMITDPFWTVEELPPSASQCHFEVPRRFGWIPVPRAASQAASAASTVAGIFPADADQQQWLNDQQRFEEILTKASSSNFRREFKCGDKFLLINRKQDAGTYSVIDFEKTFKDQLQLGTAELKMFEQIMDRT